MTADEDYAVNGNDSDGEFDYESLLQEQQAKPQPTRPDPAIAKLREEFTPIAQVAKSHMEHEAAKAEQETVAKAIEAVKADESLSNVSDKIVEGYLNLQYIRDNAFKEAFDNRVSNPTAWNSALKAASESLSGEMGSIKGSRDADDTAAALATVKGTSETEIERELEVKPKELFAMSDYDFAEFKRNLGA